MTISELVEKSHKTALDKGFYGDDGKKERNFAEFLMLIVSELGECLEAHRHGAVYPNIKNVLNIYRQYENNNDQETLNEFILHFERNIKDTIPDELADVVIRVGDLCGYLGINLEYHINAKMAYNETRKKLHGKKY